MKPCIYFRKGFWRVNPMPKPYHVHSARWALAYAFVNELNWLPARGMVA